MPVSAPKRLSLLQRLDQGPVICAEGYVFELERRGYLQAGAFVPEVVLEHPEVVTQLHRDFVHAGSDVVEALTYYAHREKLRVIGREDFIAMKIFAGGPVDMMDARAAIRVAGDSLDLTLLRRLAERYGRSTRDALEAMLRD